MKRLTTILAFVLTCLYTIQANGSQGPSTSLQNRLSQADSVRTDTLNINRTAVIPVDSTLAGKDIFNMMPSRSNGDAGTVTINQSVEIREMMKARAARNSFKEISGYRLRIYFSNAQNARAASEAAAHLFAEKYPDIPVYRIYVNPNFKVTVGDFLTKSEALALLASVKLDFPAAFIVKENIRYAY